MATASPFAPLLADRARHNATQAVSIRLQHALAAGMGERQTLPWAYVNLPPRKMGPFKPILSNQGLLGALESVCQIS
jgi:hypothetical protein